MKEIKIKNTGYESNDYAIIITLYNHVLKDDENWHFFYEGDFNIIRFSDEFEEKIFKCLDNTEKNVQLISVDSTLVKDWTDDHEIVNEFKDEFIKVFHTNSVFAMKIFQKYLNKDEINYQKIADRILHGFFNNNYYNAVKEREHVKKIGYIDEAWEALTMTDMLFGRAYYLGMRGYYLKLQEWKNKEENKSDPE